MEIRRSKLLLSFFCVCWMLGELFGVPQTKPSRPNILLVISDDQGYGDIGAHGNEKIRTPNLDRFAAEGVELTRFYVSPVCSPTRASLLTGRYHYRTGVIHTSRGGAKMHGEETTLAELLQQAGYRTAIFGKWHLGDNYPMRPQDQGFVESLVHKSGGITQAPDQPNSYFDPVLWHNGRRTTGRGYCTDVFFNGAVRFVEENRDRPFFVYLALNAPHAPLEVRPDDAEPYRKMGLDETTAKVYGMITNLDENFGRLVARLQELGLRENTVVIFMTDNGAQHARFNAGLRGRKSTTYEGGIRVPFFVQWPRGLKGGRKIDRIGAHIDLLPTISEICGLVPPKQLKLDGVSLLPLLRESKAAESWPDRILFLQCHRGLDPRRYQNSAAVSQRYKMVGYPGTFDREDFQPSLTEPVLELYDLENDPTEARNVSSLRPDIQKELQKAYDAWFTSVQSSRQFIPGIIHIGSPAENPVHLCRWQDAIHQNGKAQGWSVEIERAGEYEISIERGSFSGDGQLVVIWKGKERREPLKGGTSVRVNLAAGRGNLEVWLELGDRGRVEFTDNSTAGDVEIYHTQPQRHQDAKQH